MKTFVIINSIVGFTLLSSCSARPMDYLVDEAPHASFVKSLQAKSDAHPWGFQAFEAPPVYSSHLPTQKGVENSLLELRNNRVDEPGLHFKMTPLSKAESDKVSKAVKMTKQGIQEQSKAYKALAEGRFADAQELVWKATDQKRQADSLMRVDETTLLIDLTKDEAVAKEAKTLEEQVQLYESLPAKHELLAVIQSLDEDYIAKVSTVRPATNRDISASVKNQDASIPAMEQDTSQLVDQKDRESVLKNLDGQNVVDSPKKSLLKKVVESVSRWSEASRKGFLGTKYTLWSTAAKGQELRALQNLRDGDRAGAVEEIKLMQGSRKTALLAYKEYRHRGYGTIELENRDGLFASYHNELHQSVVKLLAAMKTDDKISSQRIKEISERLGLNH